MVALRRRIAEVRQREAWNGVSLVGPQRDDLRAELGGRDVATHASRGQQRTIILSLKLAETDILGVDGPRPIVLLDDVFSELDPDRAARLSDLIAGRGQVIVTTADPPATLKAARQRDASVWRINDGRLLAGGAVSRREEAGAAVQRALADCMGPGAAEQLALAQVRLAWSEVMADARLERGPLSSRISRVTGGTAHVEASDPTLAQELTLRAEGIVWSVNNRMRGRPGATIELRQLAVSVGHGAA